MDEADDAERASTGTCTTDCTLAETVGKTIDQETTTKIEGAASAHIVEADDEQLSCADATCDEFNYTGSATFGCWVYPDATATATTYALTHTNYSTKGGYFARADSTNHLICWIGDGASGASETSNATTFSEGEWTHVACKSNATSNEIVPYINGAANGCTEGSCQSQDDYSQDGSDLTVSLTGVGMGAYFDECFWTDKALSAAWLCRFAACGIDGTSGPCTCDGATYTDDGRLTDMSLGCSLAGVACNAACP